jgi:hypothetical protein
MLAASLALALLAPQTSRPPACKPLRPAHCDTYDLITAPEFKRQMRRFTGNRLGNYVGMGSPYLYRQFVHALGVVGINDRPVPIAPGLSMIDGCVPHNCFIGGIVILRDDGEIQAIGLSNLHVREPDDLDIFVIRAGAHNRPIMRAVALSVWGSPKNHSIPPDKVRIHFLREGKTKTVSVP